MKDLVILAADKDLEFALRGMLSRPEALGIRPVEANEAFEAALREARKPRSASLYQQIAERVSLRRCTDTAFLELKSILNNWFPSER